MAVARSMAKREFILSCDKELPQEQQTKFFLKPLSSKDESEIADLASSDRSSFIEYVQDERTVKVPSQAGYNEKRWRMLSKCLVGWANYKDAEGNEIDFEKLTPDERLSMLYPEWREELASFADSLNYPSEGELKN